MSSTPALPTDLILRIIREAETAANAEALTIHQQKTKGVLKHFADNGFDPDYDDWELNWDEDDEYPPYWGFFEEVPPVSASGEALIYNLLEM